MVRDEITIAILLFDRFTALDVVGPLEVWSRLPHCEVCFVAAEAGPKTSDTGALTFVVETTLVETPAPEVVFVPGGPGPMNLLQDEPVLSWLRQAHQTSLWTSSVCTGALLLGAAGVLDGRRATSHWLAIESLAQFGAEPERSRVVADGKVITAAGVSAGIDMALALADRLAGEEHSQAIQLGIEYDPQPPFDCGSPRKASPAVVARAQAIELAIFAGDDLVTALSELG